MNEQLLFRVQGDASSFKRAMGESKKSLNGFQQQIKGAASSLKLLMVGALTAAGYQAVRSARSFDKSMTQIKSLVGVASDEVDRMGETAKRMAKETGVSANDAAEALFFITSAGLEGAEAMEVLEASLKAAAVGLGQTKTVADLATSALNAYGSENLSAIEATDILTASVREGKLEASALAASMGSVLPVASNMGVQFHEVGAAFAAMSRTGTDAAMAATSLNAILSGLLKTTPDAEKALNEMGLSSAGLKKQIKDEGLLSVLKTLKTAFDSNDDAAQRVFPNIRALRGVLDLVGASAETNAGIFEELAISVGATDTAFKIASDSAEFKLTKALNELAVEGTELGSKVLPAIVFFVERLNNLFTDPRVEKYNESIKKLGEDVNAFLEEQKKAREKQDDVNDGLNNGNDLVIKVSKSYKEYQNELKNLFNTQTILGESFDFTTEKIRLLEKTLIKMLDATEQSSPAFAKLKKELSDLRKIVGAAQAEELAIGTDSEDIIDFSELEKELEDVKTFREQLNEINQQADKDLSESVDNMFAEHNQKRLEQFQIVSQQMQTIGGLVQQHLVAMSDTLINTLGLANDGIQGFIKTVIKLLVQLGIQQLISAMVSKAVSKIQVGTQFSVAQAGAIASATNTAAMIPFGFTLLPGMIAAATSQVGAAFAGLTAFAEGGIVTGPVMGLVGEAGSEAIIPLDRLPQLMQQSQGKQTGEFTLRGQDLILALERSGDFRSRITG
tara:strand:+ start:654 stop:2849 length:2196 start_codon:yes stop_codon:yes gene_type:complete